MPQSFLLPTILNTLIGIYYYVFMTEMNSLEKVPLHVFCVIGRSFYGMIVSFPLDNVLQTILSRFTVWVAILLLALDIFQFISLLNQFDSYNLTDALAILFGVVFMISDAVFIIQLYRSSTEYSIDIMQQEEKAKPKEMVEVIEEVYTEDDSGESSNLRNRRQRFKF